MTFTIMNIKMKSIYMLINIHYEPLVSESKLKLSESKFIEDYIWDETEFTWDDDEFWDPIPVWIVDDSNWDEHQLNWND